jgi:PEP-CTERM motif
MNRMVLLCALASVLLAGLPTSLFAAIIDGKTNVFVAGQDTTGINTMGGLFPTAIAITPGSNVLSFAVTGTTTCAATAPCNNPLGADGGNPIPGAGTNITANGTNGISGIIFTGREMFLVGVFLNDSIPTGSGPFTPTFVSTGGTYNADTDTSFQAFFLGQVFYIGDGKTGFNNAGGTTQLFNVPVGATRLFLGFADAFNNFTGAFGAYGDNGGSLNVTISGIQHGAVPEPGTMMLLGLGLAGLALLRKKTE